MREDQCRVEVREERVALVPGLVADQRQRGADLLDGVARGRVVHEARGEFEQFEDGRAVALFGVTGTREQAQREDAQEPPVVALATLVGLDRLGELEELEVLLGGHEPAQRLGRVAHGLAVAVPAELEQTPQ